MINFFSSMISGTFGLSLALMGYNYWALIFQTLSGSILRMFGLWYIVKRVPIIRFSWSSFKKQFKFGSKVFIQGLLKNILNEHSVLMHWKRVSNGSFRKLFKRKKVL